jgi:hypothetical protein
MDNNEINETILEYIKANLGGKVLSIEENAGGLWITCNDDKTYSIMVLECEQNEEDDQEEDSMPSSDHMWNTMNFAQIEKITGVQLFGVPHDNIDKALAKAKVIWDDMDYESKYQLYLIA